MELVEGDSLEKLIKRSSELRVADGYHLWSDRFDRELKDVLAIQDEIAKSIVDALQITLSPKEKRTMEQAAPAR